MNISTGGKQNSDHSINQNGIHGSFSSVIKLLLGTTFIAIMAQYIYDYTGSGEGINMIGIGAGIGLFLLFGAIWGRKLFSIIHTPYFAISGILLIAFATALGTFISQNLPVESFGARYGSSFSKVLSFFQLDDVFHSWWYVFLFLLLTISLMKISLRKKFTLPNLGFHLAHLGPIIVLMGFWVDYYSSFRGLLQLQTGQSSDLVNVYYKNTNKVKDTLNLDFKLKLDYFQSEKFKPDHRIQIWEALESNSPNSNSNSNNPRLVASIPLDLDKERKIYDSDISFVIKEFYPNFFLEYSYPENADTILPNNPGILLELINPHGRDVIQLRAKDQNRMSDPILNASFEFYWELSSELQSLLSGNNPQGTRVIIVGSENKIYETHNGVISEKELEIESEYKVPGRDKSGYQILSMFPDVSYIISNPATRNLEQENPVARLEVMRKAWEKPQEVFLFPENKGDGGNYTIQGTDYILVLGSIKDMQTKFWESGLSVLDENNTIQKQQRVIVNEPLMYSGYRFYQSDYDPNNPNYSGIGVSYTPGLYLVYFGFYVLVAGVCMLFYYRIKNHDNNV